MLERQFCFRSAQWTLYRVQVLLMSTITAKWSSHLPDAAAGKCDDHFAVMVDIKSTWTRYNVHWADLKQNCRSNIDPNYNPAQYNEMFSFVIPKSNAGFDVQLDDFTFDPGDVTTNGLTDIVKEATFNEMWTLANPDGTVTQLRNPFYTYQGMTTAASGFPNFCTT